MSDDLTKADAMGALAQSHITTFPDGGYGCLRCLAMSPPPTHDGMRTMFLAAQVFVAAHKDCAQPIDQRLAETAIGMRSPTGRA